MQPRPMLFLMASLAAGSLAASHADAAEPGMPRGSRLRLTIAGESEPVVGTLASATDDEIVLRGSRGRSPVRVPRDSIEGIERSHSRRSLAVLAGTAAGAVLLSGRGGGDGVALIGAALAFPGALAGVASVNHRRSVGRGAVAGALASGACGALLGLMIVSDDGWSSGGSGLVFGVAAYTAGIGAVAGGTAAAVGRERWTPVPGATVRVGVAPARGGGLVAGVQVSF